MTIMCPVNHLWPYMYWSYLCIVIVVVLILDHKNIDAWKPRPSLTNRLGFTGGGGGGGGGGGNMAKVVDEYRYYKYIKVSAK